MKLSTHFSLNKMKRYTFQLLSGIMLILIFLLVAGPQLSAHVLSGPLILAQRQLSGVVVDSATGNPLPGVTLQVKGGTAGTTTDAKGKYSLSVPDNAILEVSYLGYKTKEITVNGRSRINIALAAATTGLNQIVVIGYGAVKKSDVTGAVSSIGQNQIDARPVSNAIQAMQGQVAGVDVTSDQRPGQIGDITIRGVRSLTASNAPLFVVDGVPLTTGGIGYLNPNDIQSINVLKDASATAIYGSRGANGVVIITTKQGKTGEFKLSLASSVTLQKLVDNATPMNAGQYIQWRRWAYYYANPSLYPRGDQPTREADYSIFKGSSDPSAWANIMRGWASGTWDGSKVKTTDWTKMVTRTGWTREHTLSVSGGSDKIRGYASFGYLRNKGTSKGQGYTRYSGNTSLTFTPTKWFTFGANINASYGTQEYGQSASGRTAISAASSIYGSAKAVYPYAVPFDSAGERIIYPGGDQAVRTAVNEWSYSQDQRVTFRTVGSFNAQLDFGSLIPGLKGLKYRMNFGPDFSLYRDGVYIDGKSAIRNGTSYASLAKTQTFSYTLDNLIYYNRVFGKSSFDLTLLQTQTAYNDENSSLSANAIPFASQKWNALTSGNVPSLLSWNSGLIKKQLMSYMGRLNYSFANKYLLTVSGRWDGASQLAKGHKWYFFPSTAVGWRLDQEHFLQPVSWIDQLKVRFGVGTTGNSAIDPYATKGGVTSLFYPFGTTITPGSVPSTTMANQNLGWERTVQYNLGFDYSFFEGRISGSVDLYTTGTKDLLMEESIPTVTGFGTTYANVGKTANKGFDISVNTVNVQTKNFRWTTTLNASYHKDHIVALANGNQDDINNKWFIGKPIGVIYGYQAAGLWQASDSAQMGKFNASGSSFQPGMVHPVDQNGDGKIDANHDRIVIGNTLPRWVVGTVNNFSFDNFEFSFFLYGRLGYIYDTKGEAETGRFNQRLIDYYNENNTNAEYQKPIYTAGTGDIYYQSIGYRSGSFLEIRNISLAYNFPPDVISGWGMSNFRIYLQAADAGMIYSKIKWINMDVQSSYWNRGFTAGINVTF
jgi:TonB-linked SusC/RagA family outer membrane protein